MSFISVDSADVDFFTVPILVHEVRCDLILSIELSFSRLVTGMGLEDSGLLKD